MTAALPMESAAEGQALTAFRSRARWRWYEIAFWLAAVAGYFVFPGYLVLGSQIFVAGLFTLSLDLIQGYGGIITLGQAAFFGIGAYAAGLLGVHGWTEPISAMLIGGAVSALAGWICSFVIMRVSGIALLMVTLGINLVLATAVNKASSITGGDDGMQVVFQDILGIFHFDLFGKTAYCCSLIVAFLIFLVARRLVYSPFGLSLTGMRENWNRMPLIGVSLRRNGALIFTISAFIAGIAGALQCEETQFVAENSIGLDQSAAALTMLIVGGTGVLYGGFVGAIVFSVVKDQLSDLAPAYWYFWMGLALVFVVLFTDNGIVGWLTQASAWVRRRWRR